MSKLSIRLKSQKDRIVELTEQFTDHMNVEIQQRACEFMQLLDPKFDADRPGIFEPIPFKGDENMTVDVANRRILDEEEGDSQLLVDTNQAAIDRQEGDKVKK